MLNFYFLVLNPDKKTKIFNIYHKSSKLIIPTIGLSCINHSLFIKNNYTKFIDTFTVTNIYFHSLVSCSSIITDYITNPKANKIFRLINVKSHTFSLIGFIYYIINK